jgi:hypothetical protein
MNQQFKGETSTSLVSLPQSGKLLSLRFLEVPMRRRLFSLGVAGAFVLTFSQFSLGLSPGTNAGLSGLSGPAKVTAGWGRASDDGLARPGFPSRTRAGQIGMNGAGVKGSTNPGTEKDFNLAGLGRVHNGGIGRSTMENVPGITPVYINTVAGTRMAPFMGSRGP